MTNILFKNATLVDINHKATPGYSVLVEDNTIKAIEQGDIICEADKEYDLTGKYLMPGLIDAHIHLGLISTDLRDLKNYSQSYVAMNAATMAKQLLLNGFTTVRDAAGIDLGFAEAIENDLAIGPRVFLAGSIICKTGGHGDTRMPHDEMETCACHLLTHLTTLVADGVDGVRKAAREAIRRGAHQIKIAASGGVLTERNSIHAPQFSVNEIKAIVEEAQDAETYVMAHAHGTHGIKRAIEAGIRSIEHCSFLNDELAELMIRHNTYMVPTLVVADIILNSSNLSENIIAKVKHAKAASHAAIRTALKYDVKIGLGSDTLGGKIKEQPHELVLRSEFQSPYDVLVSATAVNAEIMQLQDKLGVIKTSALADLIVTEFNPMDDLTPFTNPDGEHVKLVMKDGRIYKDKL